MNNDLIDIIVPEKHLQTQQVKDFVEECVSMIQLYAKKNHDYGDSFNKGMSVIGFAYGLGRLYDKMNRLIELKDNKPEITDESIADTVKDLACYSVMTSVYLKKQVPLPLIDFEGNDNTNSLPHYTNYEKPDTF